MMFELSPVKICVLQECFLFCRTEKKPGFSFHFLPELKDNAVQPFTLPQSNLRRSAKRCRRRWRDGHVPSTTEVQALGLLPARHEGRMR